MELQRTLLGDNIRKILIGYPQAAMSYEVGHSYPVPRSADKIHITEIVRDENAYFITGQVLYIISAKLNNTGEPFVWKYCEGQPVVIENKIPDTK